MSDARRRTYPLYPVVWQGTIPAGADKMRYDTELLKHVRDSIHAKFPECFDEDQTGFSRSGVDDQFLLLIEAKSLKPMSPDFWANFAENIRAELKDKKPVVFLRSTGFEEATQ